MRLSCERRLGSTWSRPADACFWCSMPGHAPLLVPQTRLASSYPRVFAPKFPFPGVTSPRGPHGAPSPPSGLDSKGCNGRRRRRRDPVTSPAPPPLKSPSAAFSLLSAYRHPPSSVFHLLTCFSSPSALFQNVCLTLYGVFYHLQGLKKVPGIQEILNN